MTEAVGKEIAIEGVDPRELYGPRNTYLDQIKALHPQLRIVARGSSLKVLGSEAETQRFGRHMEGLVALLPQIRAHFVRSHRAGFCRRHRRTGSPG